MRGLGDTIGKFDSHAAKIRKALIERKWIEERARKLFLASKSMEVIGVK